MTEKIIELTKRCRPAHYKDLAAAAEQFSYCQKSPLRYLQEELKGNILEPLNKDTLFEIAVLFKTMHTAAECGWQEQQAGLIGGSSRAVSTWVKFGRELKIYYQKLPNALSQTSMYGRLMTEYGLSDKLRRPDIILELSGGKIKKIFIVEVKRSERPRLPGRRNIQTAWISKGFWTDKQRRSHPQRDSGRLGRYSAKSMHE